MAKVIKFEDVLRRVAAGKDPDELLHSQPLYVQKMWHHMIRLQRENERLNHENEELRTQLEGKATAPYRGFKEVLASESFQRALQSD